MGATFDINTSAETVDGTPPRRTFQPLRYTTSTLDEARVGVWLLLSTWLGTSRLATDEGFDYESAQDPDTSDAEIGELAANVALSYPAVTSVSVGPDVSRDEDGTLLSISMTCETAEGPFPVTLPVT